MSQHSSKKVHRFLLANALPAYAAGDIVTIADSRIAHQITSVLRMERDDHCIFFSDTGDDMLAAIVRGDKTSLTVQVIESRPVAQPKTRAIAIISIPKGDAFEIVTQKLTELGIAEIVPLIAARTVKQSTRTARLQAISDEALEQCGGSNRVLIHEPTTLAECLSAFACTSYYGDPRSPEARAHATAERETVAFYAGPEGGWTEQELSTLAEKGVSPLYLGNRILRTETAAIVGCYELLR